MMTPSSPRASGILITLATLAMGACSAASPASPVCLAGAYLNAQGQCQSVSSPTHRMPFREGFKARVTQGFHGYHSHKDDLAYSIDFKCEEGEPVVASREGIVWDARKDSDQGCPSESCADKANFVIVDHGDGTYTEYYHLQHWGAMVEPGQQVCAGQLIGLCGNTGFSSGTHLHFAIIDQSRQTIPVRFREAADPGLGFVVPDMTYTSRNRRDLTCPTTSYSPLHRDAFAHHGIILDKPMPLWLSLASAKPLTLQASYYGPHPQVAIHTKAVSGGAWKNFCVPVQGGRVTATLDWKALAPEGGFYWLMLTGANAKCEAPGWAWSYKVQLAP